MKNPYAIRFPNGLIIRGADPRDILDRIAAIQMMKHTPDAKEMRQMLSDRAWVWSQSIVDPDASDLEFLIACAQARLFEFTIK